MINFFLLFIFIVNFCDLFSTPTPYHTPYHTIHYNQLTTKRGSFLDAQGRSILLRGINVAGDSKVPPFKPITDLNDLLKLKQLGFNTFRLLFTWEAFEPIRNYYDESYLQYIKDIVAWAQEKDIYIIIDFHQDAFSRYSLGGCGEGFPKWTIPHYIHKYEPDNSENCWSWGAKMLFSPELKKTFKAFYRNDNDVRESFIAMIKKVVQEMRPYSSVIGYDLLNEPQGDEISDISDLYEDISFEIKKINPNTILFLNPKALVGSGIVTTKLRRPTFSNAVYAPHYYDATILGFHYWLGFPPSIPLYFQLKTAKKWGAPYFLGEFGHPAKTTWGKNYLNDLYDYLDENFLSGAQWNYSPTWNPETKDGWNGEDFSILDDHQKLRGNFTPRPYPSKTAGIPLKLRVNIKKNKTTLIYRYEHDPMKGVTEIVVPTILNIHHYEIEWKKGSGTISISDDNSKIIISSPHNKIIEVKINFNPLMPTF